MKVKPSVESEFQSLDVSDAKDQTNWVIRRFWRRTVNEWQLFEHRVYLTGATGMGIIKASLSERNLWKYQEGEQKFKAVLEKYMFNLS